MKCARPRAIKIEKPLLTYGVALNAYFTPLQYFCLALLMHKKS